MADLMSAPKKKAKGKGKPKVTWKPAVAPGRRSVTPDLGATQRNSLSDSEDSTYLRGF